MSLQTLKPMTQCSVFDINRKRRANKDWQTKPVPVSNDLETSVVTTLVSSTFGDIRLIVEENEIYVICVDMLDILGFATSTTTTSYYRNTYRTTFRFINVEYNVQGRKAARRQKTIVTPLEDMIESVKNIDKYVKGKNATRVLNKVTEEYKKEFLDWLSKEVECLKNNK